MKQIEEGSGQQKKQPQKRSFEQSAEPIVLTEA